MERKNNLHLFPFGIIDEEDCEIDADSEISTLRKLSKKFNKKS